MTPEEREDFYNKEIKPLFDDWREIDKKYWKYLDQFFTTRINGKLISEATKFLPEEWEKLWEMSKELEEKKKKFDEAAKRWFSSFR